MYGSATRSRVNTCLLQYYVSTCMVVPRGQSKTGLLQYGINTCIAMPQDPE